MSSRTLQKEPKSSSSSGKSSTKSSVPKGSSLKPLSQHKSVAKSRGSRSEVKVTRARGSIESVVSGSSMDSGVGGVTVGVENVQLGNEAGRTEKEHNFAVMSQLKLTKPAPEFSGTAVLDGDFKQISLSDYKGKYVVFFFYPFDFTFVCPTEIIAFSERAEEFQAINCQVIACSTDSHFSHLAWLNTPRKQGGLGSMNIPLLADKTYEIAKAYGVLKEDEGAAFRGLFIIDDKGNLRQITINDMPVGRSVDETLRLVQAFQFTDKHGEVCPVGWKPGKDTMKPDPNASKSYFQKNH